MAFRRTVALFNMSKFRAISHQTSASHIREYPNAIVPSQEQPLQLHVNQYIPLSNPQPTAGDITIISSHACGFPKEIYEPLWDDLHDELATRGTKIRAIWAIDSAWQGKSGLLNGEYIGIEPSWLDYSRDILHFINTFHKDLPRPLFAVGHSFGAAALVNTASFHPRLFTRMVLLDPVISRYAATPGEPAGAPASQSACRRETWPSREAAREAFSRSSFYSSWDKRVFDKWVDHGITAMPTVKFHKDHSDYREGGVTLTTTRDQEVFTYCRPSFQGRLTTGEIVDRAAVPDIDESMSPSETYPFYRPEGGITMTRLPALRPPALYVHGEKSRTSTPFLRKPRVEITGVGQGGSGGLAAGKVKEELMLGIGHLVAMERPKECAVMAADWIKQGCEEYNTDMERYNEFVKQWKGDKRILPQEWNDRLDKVPVRPAKRGTKI